MDQNPIKTTVRKENRKQRLGTDRACALCRESNLECLMPSSILEEHHPAGRAHDSELTVTLCRNCHARETENQRREGVPLTEQQTILELVIAAMKGVAVFLESLARALMRFAEKLQEFLGLLDANFPTWRTLAVSSR